MTDISIVLNIRDVKHSLRAAMSLALCSRDSMLNGTNSPMGSVCSRSRHFVRLPYAVRGDVRTETLAGEVI